MFYITNDKIIMTLYFYNELIKHLKFRLTELYDIVDYFVMMESTYTVEKKGVF